MAESIIYLSVITLHWLTEKADGKKIHLEIIACVETARFFVPQNLRIINDAATEWWANNKGRRNALLNLRTSINNKEHYRRIKGMDKVDSISTAFEYNYYRSRQEFLKLTLNLAAETAGKAKTITTKQQSRKIHRSQNKE